MIGSPGIVTLVFFGLLLCCVLCLYRMAMGPSAPDRMVAIDVLGTVVVGVIAVIAVMTGKAYLLDVVLVWALVSFVGTLALAKFIEGRELDD